MLTILKPSLIITPELELFATWLLGEEQVFFMAGR